MDSRPLGDVPPSVFLTLALTRFPQTPRSAEGIDHLMSTGGLRHVVHLAAEHRGPWSRGLDRDLSPGADLEHSMADVIRAFPVRAAVAVLPAPGDSLGIPAQAGSVALDAGECVLVASDETDIVLIPFTENLSNPVEPIWQTRWSLVPTGPWRMSVCAAVGSVADAEQNLGSALRTAVQTLEDLDVAKWRPEAAERIAELLSGRTVQNTLATLGVTPSLPARTTRVLDRALTLRAIVSLAQGDDGAAVNAHESNERRAALCEVDRAARRAVSAATMWEA